MVEMNDWHKTFREMDHEDRVMTFLEDPSTLEALLDEYDALAAAARVAVEVCVPDWPGQDPAFAVEARAAALDALRAALPLSMEGSGSDG